MAAIPVFDIGNVLVEWTPHGVFRSFFATKEAVDAFLAEIGFWSWNIEQDRGRPMPEGIALLTERYPHHAKAIMAYGARFQESIPGPVPGMPAVLEACLERGPVYAITNFNQDTFRDTKERFAFLSRFTDVVVSGEERLVKPDAAIYNLLLERNGLKAGDCLFIDDSPANVAAARSVGMQAVHFTGADNLRRDLAGHGIVIPGA